MQIREMERERERERVDAVPKYDTISIQYFILLLKQGMYVCEGGGEGLLCLCACMTVRTKPPHLPPLLPNPLPHPPPPPSLPSCNS